MLGGFTRKRFNFPEPDSRLRQETDSFSAALWFFVLLIVFSALQARFNFLHFVPLFSSFRVSARFVVFISFGLCVLASFFLEEFVLGRAFRELQKRGKSGGRLVQVSLLALVLFLVSDLYFHLGSYNQTVIAKAWYKVPRTVQYLQDNLEASYRILPLRESYLASSIYFKQRGWRKDPEAFLDCQKLISRNRGLLWNIPSVSSYTGIGLHRADLFLNFIREGFVWNSEKEKIYPVAGIENLLSYGAVGYVLSPLEIEGEGFVPVFDSELALSGHRAYVYEVESSLPRARFVPQARFVSSEQEAFNVVAQGLVDPAKVVVLEGRDKTGGANKTNGGTNKTNKTDILLDEDQKIVIKVSAPTDGYLVLSDTYYPGWKAYVERNLTLPELNSRLRQETDSFDRTNVPILRANYNFRAVPVLAGEQIVTFVYEPESLRVGVLVSLTSLALLVGLMVYWRIGL